jgi:hypothetical protein
MSLEWSMSSRLLFLANLTRVRPSILSPDASSSASLAEAVGSVALACDLLPAAPGLIVVFRSFSRTGFSPPSLSLAVLLWVADC